MHLWATREDPRTLHVRFKGYTPPPPLPTSGGHTPMAVVVVHQDGRIRHAYVGHSLDGIEKFALRTWCFIHDWQLPMAVYIDVRDPRGLIPYTPNGHQTTQARAGQRIDAGPLVA